MHVGHCLGSFMFWQKTESVSISESSDWIVRYMAYALGAAVRNILTDAIYE